MIVIHLLAGLALGFLAALAAWAAGLPLWAMLGAYVLGVNVGVLGSAGTAGRRREDTRGRVAALPRAPDAQDAGHRRRLSASRHLMLVASLAGSAATAPHLLAVR